MFVRGHEGCRTRQVKAKMRLAAVLTLTAAAHAQTAAPNPNAEARDPGVRGGAAGAGGALGGITSGQSAMFAAGLADFNKVDSVAGLPGTDPGLGPRFNLDSCGGCHAQPASGGSSPAVNPQVAVASKMGATNTVPQFITQDGPVREVRFKSDGGVHGLFTIAGRSDAPNCTSAVLAQPTFDPNNISFRVPSPVFGGGLIEAVSDSAILQNKSANAAPKQAAGISGHENRSGNDGTITRLGWKAQNKSLAIFASEAYNVEQGITNDAFPNERDETPQCLFTASPEDHDGPDNASDSFSDIQKFVAFMRFLAPPAPVTSYGTVTTASINSGRMVFSQIGCALCHTPTLTTGTSPFAQLNNQPVNLFSDLLVHNMGSGLADGISQGGAGPNDFRTAPLWGLGQRIFFLHDGRTKDLVQAIQAHSSSGSEANSVVVAFGKLPNVQKQDLLNFLRSL